MAWLASVRIGLTSWRTVPLPFSSCFTLVGALDRDAQKPFCYASEAKGHHEGDNQFHKGLAVAKQLKIRGFMLEINGDGPVFAGLAGAGSHGSSSGQMVGAAADPRWTNAFIISRGWGRRRGFTTKIDGMWILHLRGLGKNSQNGHSTAIHNTLSPSRTCGSVTAGVHS